MAKWMKRTLFVLGLLLVAGQVPALDQEHGQRLEWRRENAWRLGPRVASLAPLYPDIVRVPPLTSGGSGDALLAGDPNVWTGTQEFPVVGTCGTPPHALHFDGATNDGLCYDSANVLYVGKGLDDSAARSWARFAAASLELLNNDAAQDGTGKVSIAQDSLSAFVHPVGDDAFDLTADLTVANSPTYTMTLADGATINEFSMTKSSTLLTKATTFGTAAGAADSIALQETAGCITWEGSTADTIQGRLCVADPTVSDKLWTVPNAAGTVALAEVNNSFTVAQSIQTGSFGSSVTLVSNNGINLNVTNGFIDWGATIGGLNSRVATTPDTLEFYLGTASLSLHILQGGDEGFDFNNGPCGTSACTDPTLIIHSHNQATGEFTSVQAGAIVGTMTKALTEGAATDVVRIGVAASTGRGGVIEYTVHANDGADFQTRGGGSFSFSVQNIGGTETCTMNPAAPDQTNDSNAATISAGTLTYAWTCTSAVDATVDLELNAVSSLTETTLKVDYVVRVYGPGTVAAQ